MKSIQNCMEDNEDVNKENITSASTVCLRSLVICLQSSPTNYWQKSTFSTTNGRCKISVCVCMCQCVWVVDSPHSSSIGRLEFACVCTCICVYVEGEGHNGPLPPIPLPLCWCVTSIPAIAHRTAIPSTTHCHILYDCKLGNETQKMQPALALLF